jgi:hypothetical protein
MSSAYEDCHNLTGSPVCGPNVTNMSSTYAHCYNLTGKPVCGPNVTNIGWAYQNCYNLTGSPVCGDKVTDMEYAYYNCQNLTGSPVCGPNVTDMYCTYCECKNLTGSPVCGPNVTNMYQAYGNCTNIGPNGYFYSNKVNTVNFCFSGRNVNSRLNLYVPSTGYNYSHNTYKSCLRTVNGSTLIGDVITWTNDNNCHYNTAYNIYIYPVANVREAYIENELSVAIYTMSSGSDVIPQGLEDIDYTVKDITNDDGTVSRKLMMNEEGVEVTNISFQNQTGLISVDKLKLDKVTDASNMFNGCTDLISVNITTADVVNIRKADYMFAGCSNLTTVDFEFTNIESAVGIFNDCVSLE